jgi:predicted nicotinamide N-methyase
MTPAGAAGRGTERTQAAIQAFIRANMRLADVPTLPGLRIYAATPTSGLHRLAEPRGGGGKAAPYWAYPWAGGIALARHVLEQPRVVAGRGVLDLGAGSGIVAIAAAKAGAKTVMAADIDRNAAAALALNAAANGVDIPMLCADLTDAPPPEVDLVLVGDLFYEAGLAQRVAAFLDRCLAAGIAVLVGDPGRADLPRDRLRLVAEYRVADFGMSTKQATTSGVYTFEPARL